MDTLRTCGHPAGAGLSRQAWPAAMDQHPERAPQPPDLSTSSPMVAAPQLAAGSNALQRLRDAVAVRFALRRGAGASLDPGVEIVSGIGAPRWNERAHRVPLVRQPADCGCGGAARLADRRTGRGHTGRGRTGRRATGRMPPVAVPPVAMPPVAMPPVAVPPSHHPWSNPDARRFLARLTAEPAIRKPLTRSNQMIVIRPTRSRGIARPSLMVATMPPPRDDRPSNRAPRARRRTGETRSAAGTEAPALADVLSEVASLAAPLERTPAPGLTSRSSSTICPTSQCARRCEPTSPQLSFPSPNPRT